MFIAKITAILALISAIFAFEDMSENNHSAIDLILSSSADKPKKEFFKVYHFLFKKEYSLNSEEALLRYRIFKDNLRYIKETNEQNLSFKLGVNQFSDMTNEEFRAKILMKPQEFQEATTRFLQSAQIDFDEMADSQDDIFDDGDDAEQTNFLPVNWTNHFNPPLNQGGCGGCWAFTAAASIEGNYNKKYNKTITLSPQQIIDCDKRSKGCKGGSPNLTFQTYAKNNSLTLLEKYPYKGITGECRTLNRTDGITKVTSYQYCTNIRVGERLVKCTKESYYNMLAKGPVALMMDARSRNFQNYKSGVLAFNKTDCVGANHAVTGVGYFNDSLNGEGIIVRNSWGLGWGDRGYFRVKYDAAVKDTCLLTSSIFWPNVQ